MHIPNLLTETQCNLNHTSYHTGTQTQKHQTAIIEDNFLHNSRIVQINTFTTLEIHFQFIIHVFIKVLINKETMYVPQIKDHEVDDEVLLKITKGSMLNVCNYLYNMKGNFGITPQK